MTPNESHSLWQQFQYDSLVYSLFNTSSNQSSLRQIKYKEKLWDIKNEFFWISKSEIMELAENKFFDDVSIPVFNSGNENWFSIQSSVQVSSISAYHFK